MVVAFIRRFVTASGATAVQICEKQGRKRVTLEHIGSAHTPLEAALLEEEARRRLQVRGQGELDLGLADSFSGEVNGLVRDLPVPGQIQATGSVSRVLWEVLDNAYHRIGFDVLGDEAFKQLVLARIVEPGSKSDTARVVSGLGIESLSIRTFHRCLQRIIDRDYQDTVCRAAFDYATSEHKLGLALFDTTTLHFATDKTDELKTMGRSKEGRYGPQVQYGLLTDREGFPLEFVLFPGNKGETRYLVPAIEALVARHGSALDDLVVIADAGILSAANCGALEDLGLYFIVGSKTSSVKQDLLAHLTDEELGAGFTDGQIFETTRIMTHKGKRSSRRVVYQYREKRGVRDRKVLADQKAHALQVQSNPSRLTKAKFVTIDGKTTRFNEKLYDQAMARTGLKGYVTNLPQTLDGNEIITWYSDLFQIERSFRMTKSDLNGRPFYHHTTKAIRAHLVIVFTALAVARHLQQVTGTSIKQLLKDLQPLRDVTIKIGDLTQTIPTQIPQEHRHYLKIENG